MKYTVKSDSKAPMIAKAKYHNNMTNTRKMRKYFNLFSRPGGSKFLEPVT